MLPTMVQNYHKESLAKFPLPSCPNEENHVTTMEYDEAMKEYRDDWAAAQALHECRIRWEQVEDACCSADVARVQAEADRLWHEAAEQTRKWVQVKSPGNELTRSCRRCVVKGKLLVFDLQVIFG